MLHSRGAIFICAVLLVLIAGCGTGNRLDTADPGQLPDGFYLPPVQLLDIRLGAELVAGTYDGAGNDLTYPADTSPTSGADFTISDGTAIHSDDQEFDVDGNGVIDYIIFTIRSLSAQAKANTTIMGDNGLEDPDNFFLVGGVSYEPNDATFSQPASINLPLAGAAAATAGSLLPVYKFAPAFVDGRNLSGDIGTGSGWWELVGDGTVADNGLTVVINIDSFGQYAVVSETVIHNQGQGSDI